MDNPQLLDYGLNRGVFLLWDTELKEYQVTLSMVPWLVGDRAYLIRTKSYKLANDTFHAELRNK